MLDPVFILRNLQEHFELLVGKEGKKTILFPLCGKTVDMRWVAEKGHNAVGVEGSDIAAESFFEENNIEYKRAAINLAPNGVQIFSSLDDRIRIFVCNFFDFQSSVAGGKLDAAFDRGSLVAVNPKDRPRYANKMADLLKPGGKILAECFEYDPTVFGGPPHHVPEAHLREIYEENFVVDKLSKEVDENPRFKNNFNIDEMTMCVYLKTRK